MNKLSEEQNRLETQRSDNESLIPDAEKKVADLEKLKNHLEMDISKFKAKVNDYVKSECKVTSKEK